MPKKLKEGTCHAPGTCKSATLNPETWRHVECAHSVSHRNRTASSQSQLQGHELAKQLAPDLQAKHGLTEVDEGRPPPVTDEELHLPAVRELSSL